MLENKKTKDQKKDKCSAPDEIHVITTDKEDNTISGVKLTAQEVGLRAQDSFGQSSNEGRRDLFPLSLSLSLSISFLHQNNTHSSLVQINRISLEETRSLLLFQFLKRYLCRQRLSCQVL
jgi:hypothetical protein